MLGKRSLSSKIAECWGVLLGHFTRWRCYHCWRDVGQVQAFFLPFGEKGAIIPFCCDCFQTASTVDLELAIRDMVLNENYIRHHSQGAYPGEVMQQATQALRYFKGEVEEKPFENPFFKKDLADFPGDPTATEGVGRAVISA